MTEIYQPVIVKELLKNNGSCTKTDLAAVLAKYDLSVLDYYKKILMRWPKATLSKHGIVQYQRKGELFKLSEELVDLSSPEAEIKACDQKIAEWLERKGNIENSPQVNVSLRYSILKRAKGKCELCGIPSSLRPIDIDHIVPQSQQNKNGKVKKDGICIDVHSEENLQALCFKCNRAKRATDNTDFRRTQKLVRDHIPDIIRSSGRRPKIRELSGSKLLVALNEKLVEEHEEYISEAENGNSVGELADMIEVIITIAKHKGYSREDLFECVDRKRKAKGGFDKCYYYSGCE